MTSCVIMSSNLDPDKKMFKCWPQQWQTTSSSFPSSWEKCVTWTSNVYVLGCCCCCRCKNLSLHAACWGSNPQTQWWTPEVKFGLLERLQNQLTGISRPWLEQLWKQKLRCDEGMEQGCGQSLKELANCYTTWMREAAIARVVCKRLSSNENGQVVEGVLWVPPHPE